MGGLTSDWNSKIEIAWNDINTDEMRPAKRKIVGNTNPNLPHVGGRYAKFGDHFDAFIAGFEDYARFPRASNARRRIREDLFDGFRRRAGPQGGAPDAILFDAAAAAEESPDHG